MKTNTPDPPRRDLPDRTFDFARRILAVCSTVTQRSSAGRALITQLLRSATSVGANIEEGQGSHSRADFAAKYSIACKEVREAHYWLRLLATTDIIDNNKLQPLIDEATQLVAILTTIVRKVKKPQQRPRKSPPG